MEVCPLFYSVLRLLCTYRAVRIRDSTLVFDTYTVDLLNPQIFGKNDLYIDYCLFLNPYYVFLFVIIFVESHLTSDCF